MIVGIDLGTTNSLVAYYTEEGPKIIPNRLGKNLTPSVVSVDENDEIWVGETAMERSLLYPDTVAQVFKRSMGTGKKYRLGSRTFTPEELSSFVLRALKQDAEEYLKEPVEEAVISVPAYFDDKRRKATKRAGELAGLKVERIISEPTAAAIAYGLYEKSRDTRFLVFDLGGGTFDVSILELYDNILEVRAVAGDNYLGGEDFTEILEKDFLNKMGLDVNNLDRKLLAHIRDQAEKCKIALSSSREAVMACTVDGEKKEMAVSYHEYEKECEPLLERIRRPVQRSLSDTRLKLSDIDVIVLVGGGTKFQIVRDFIIRLFKKFPDTSVNPDEAVALGAAVQAAMKERREEVKEVILTDVCSFTLGTEVVVERGRGVFEKGHFCPIIERNTVIPASRTERFYTVYDDQTKLSISVLQGESRFAENNLLLGEITVNVPKNRAGAEAVDVTYTYDINSILEVEIKVISTGEKKKVIMKGKDSTLTDEEIAERMETLSYLKIPPKEKEENKLLLLRGERFYEESTGEDRLVLEYLLRRFEDALDSRDGGKISKAREELQEKLRELEEI